MEIKLTRSDLYLVTLFMLIAIPITFSGYDYKAEGYFEASWDTIVYTIFTLLLTYIIVYRLFPIYFPKQQIVRLFIWTVLVMMIMGSLEILCYIKIGVGGFDTITTEKIMKLAGNYKFWLNGISTSAQNAGIMIGILLGKKFYDSQLSLQKSEQQKRESELRLLKSQVDPHFLFNNLNTVDSLIDTRPEVAKTYLQKLAQLYRYLIRTKDDEVVTIDEELAFAKNYIYLLEQRYGAAYSFDIQTQGNTNDLLIPPGALQTLLENVVKHNQGDVTTPIQTLIVISEKEISVTNNTQPKKRVNDSYGVGLNNLKARYKMLSDKEIKILGGQKYTVVLPTLKAIS